MFFQRTAAQFLVPTQWVTTVLKSWHPLLASSGQHMKAVAYITKKYRSQDQKMYSTSLRMKWPDTQVFATFWSLLTLKIYIKIAW